MQKIFKTIKDKIKFIFASRKRITIAAVILLVLIIGVWRLRAARQTTPQYQTATVQKGTIVQSVSASGNVILAGMINVNTQASGIVNAVYVKDGDKVVAGQKIATITLDSDGALRNAQAWASLVSANSALSNANNNYRASQATVANVYDQLQGHATDETFAQRDTRTKAEVANDNAYNATLIAQANLAAASLSYRTSSPVITAPYSGTVDSLGLVEGMVLSTLATSTGATSSQRVATIKSDTNPLISVNITEVDLPSVKYGQAATITFDAIPDKTFTGKVVTVDRVGVTASGVTNYPVIIKFDTMAEEILPNMAATANIITAEKSDVLMIPSAALTTSSGQNMAKVLRNGQEVDVPVEIGISSDTDTEIISGLSEGDKVITGAVSQTSSTSTSPFSTFRLGGNTGGAVRVGGGGR